MTHSVDVLYILVRGACCTELHHKQNIVYIYYFGISRPSRRYGYNQETETCEEFTYGGCKGNRNSFLKMEECVNTCQVE